MKTPEEIKKALACPVREQDYLLGCSCCSYHGRGKPPCLPEMHEDALAYIQQLEEQVEFMKIQMQGDCGSCKHTNVTGGKEPCASCMLDASRPSWEYGGLPELPKEGDRA